LTVGERVRLGGADSGPIVHEDRSRDPLVESPPVKFGGPTAGVVGGRAETENDDAEIVEKMAPHEAEQETPQQRYGETVIESFDITGGDPAARGD